MAKYLKLQIPQSCSEDWNQMIPEERGRFCNSCQKTVTDFTRMSDSELIEFFKNHKGEGCGKFTTDQLDREILIPKNPFPGLKYLYRLAIPAFLFSMKANAQQRTIGRIKVEASPVKCKTNSPLEETNRLKGRVTDNSGIAIPGASVVITGTIKGTVADSAGYFELSNFILGDLIQVSSVGFISKEVRITEIKNDLQVIMESQPLALGEVIITSDAQKRMGGYMGGISVVVVKTQDIPLGKSPDSKDSLIQFYPNPVSVGSTIKIKNLGFEKGEAVASVFSLDGKLVQSSSIFISKKGGATELPVRWVAAGNYLIQLVNKKSGKQTSGQIMIMR